MLRAHGRVGVSVARARQVAAALALQGARDEAGFGAYDQQKRVQEAARGRGE